MVRARSLTTLVALAAGVLFLACDAKGPATPSNDPCHPTPPARCANDTECYPFLCKSSFCDQKCTTSATCVPGFVCSGEGMCVKAATCGTCSGDYDCPAGKTCELKSSTCR